MGARVVREELDLARHEEYRRAGLQAKLPAAVRHQAYRHVETVETDLNCHLHSTDSSPFQSIAAHLVVGGGEEADQREAAALKRRRAEMLENGERLR